MKARKLKFSIIFLFSSRLFASVLFLGIFFFFSYRAKAQVSVGFTIGGIAYHPLREANARIYKWKFDRQGHFVGYTGLSIFVSYRINRYVGIKLIQAIVLHDCAGKFAGITHLGINLFDDILAWNDRFNEFSMSIGPFWYYRRNWTKEKAYRNMPDFISLSANKRWEKKFVWYGGQIEFDHFSAGNQPLVFNFLPGLPYIFTLGIGSKIMVNKK